MNFKINFSLLNTKQMYPSLLKIPDKNSSKQNPHPSTAFASLFLRFKLFFKNKSLTLGKKIAQSNNLGKLFNVAFRIIKGEGIMMMTL